MFELNKREFPKNDLFYSLILTGHFHLRELLFSFYLFDRTYAVASYCIGNAEMDNAIFIKGIGFIQL